MNRARRGKGFLKARRKRVKSYEMMPVALWINEYPIFYIEAYRQSLKVKPKITRFTDQIYSAIDVYNQRFPASDSLTMSTLNATLSQYVPEEIDNLLHYLTVVANKMLKAGLDITDIRNSCIEKKQVVILRDTFRS